MAKSKVEEWQSLLGTRNFDPLEIFDLQDAVKVRADSVVLSGATFKLTYKGRDSQEVVHYKPERGFVPRGTLNVYRLLRGI